MFIYLAQKAALQYQSGPPDRQGAAALNVALSLLPHRPDDVILNNVASHSYLLGGDLDAARRHLLRARQSEPADSLMSSDVEMLYHLRTNNRAGLDDLLSRLERMPDVNFRGAANTLDNMAAAALALDDSDRADAITRRNLRINP
jgi:Flp pilus assembly protein TadD